MSTTCHGVMLKQEFPKILYLTQCSLIYISDLCDDFTLIRKVFMDGISLFSIVQNINSAANDPNNYIIKTKYLVF